MPNASVVGRFLLVGAVVTGCVRTLPPPPANDVTLGSLKAPVRDYAAAGQDPCRTEPLTLLSDLAAMNDLLASFLDQTSAGPAGVWADEHVQLLDQARAVLPRPLDLHEATLAALPRCGFGSEYKATVEDLQRRGEEYTRQARQRVRDAPVLLTELRRKQALAAWKDAEAKAQEQEHQSWCPPQQKLRPDVFYAWEDETGRLEWLFCDGAKVVAEPGGEPKYVPAPAGKSRSIQTPAGYVKTAKNFPDSEIRRPPREVLGEATTRPSESE